MIPKLLGRIGELEQRVEACEKSEALEKVYNNKPTKSINSVESKISKTDMNKIELKLDDCDDDLKMKTIEKKLKNKLAKSKKREKQLWIALLCVCILGVSVVFQNILSLKGYPRKLP